MYVFQNIWAKIMLFFILATMVTACNLQYQPEPEQIIEPIPQVTEEPTTEPEETETPQIQIVTGNDVSMRCGEAITPQMFYGTQRIAGAHFAIDHIDIDYRFFALDGWTVYLWEPGEYLISGFNEDVLLASLTVSVSNDCLGTPPAQMCNPLDPIVPLYRASEGVNHYHDCQ